MLPNVNMIPPITNIPNIGLSVKLKYSTIVTIINIPTISDVAAKISIFDIKKREGIFLTPSLCGCYSSLVVKNFIREGCSSETLCYEFQMILQPLFLVVFSVAFSIMVTSSSTTLFEKAYLAMSATVMIILP